MRLLYMANNQLGWKVLEHLCAAGEDQIVGLVVHPPHKQKYREPIVATAGLPEANVFDGSRLREPDVLERIRELGCDAALSVLFGYILKPPFLQMFPRGVVNLHTSYLPYNRGAYPNVWSIVDDTPAGVTMHYIDEGVDSGDIIAQERVDACPTDTGESLYRKLEQAALDLFRTAWPKFRTGHTERRPQDGKGTYHRIADAEHIDRIDLDRTYKARELIDILRARTFPPHHGAYFECDGKRVYLRLSLEHEKGP